MALSAIKAQSSNQGKTEPVLQLLESLSKRSEPGILLGEPGAGKTTALEALTYHLAHRAYRLNILLFVILISVAALAALVTPLISVVWLMFFILWEPWSRRALMPLFLEARLDFDGDQVKNFAKRLGENPLFGSRRYLVLLIDGVNEMAESTYSSFINGWEAQLRDQSRRRVIFTSRVDQSPAKRLKIMNVLTVCDLDDAGVKEFLKVYGREQAAAEEKKYSSDQAEHDFSELQNKDLLSEGGIGRNPYWLRMIVESGLYTPNRASLFHSFAEKLISRELEEKPEERKRVLDWKTLVPVEVEMNALASLALAMHRERTVGFKDEAGWKRGVTAIRECIDDAAYSPTDVLREAEAATLLRMHPGNTIDFIHQLVQEFFAAYALRQEAKWKEALTNCDDHWWWQTLFILGGLIGEKSQDALERLVRLVLDDGSNQQRIFASIGLLRSVADPPPHLSNKVVTAFARSMRSKVTSYGWSRVDQEVQLRAIDELKRALGERVTEAFGALLENPNRDVQISGIFILSTIGGRRAAELIISKMQYPTSIELGSRVLVPMGVPAVEPLIDAIQNDDGHIRYVAIEALGELRDSRAIEPLLVALKAQSRILDIRHIEGALQKIAAGSHDLKPFLRALRDENENVAEGAMNVLMSLAHPASVEPLIADLKNENFNVRRRAARILGQTGDPRAVVPLINTLGDGHEGLHKEASRACARIGGPAAKALVLRLGDEDAEALDLVNILVAIGAPAVEPLIAGLRFTGVEHQYYGDLRERAADALAEIGDRRAVEALIGALGDKGHRYVRSSAAHALGKIGDARAVEPLIAALNDEAGEVRFCAANALAALGAVVVEPLMKIFKSKTPGLVPDILIEIGGPAVKSLTAALSGRERRGLALSTLEKIYTPMILEPLMRTVKDKDLMTRKKAISNLCDLADPEILEALERIGRANENAKLTLQALVMKVRATTEEIKRVLSEAS